MNDSIISVGSFLLLQSDWNKALNKVGDKVWVTLKHHDGNSHSTSHGKICITGFHNNYPQFNQTENFVVEKFCKYSIDVSNSTFGVSMQFIAPIKEFAHIHKKCINAMDISSGGGLGVSSSSDESLCIWDTGSGDILRTLNGHAGEVNCCKFFPSGVVVLTGGMDTQLKIWSAEDGKCARTLNKSHKSRILDIDFVERGRNIVSCSRDGSVCLWECGSGSCIDTIVDERSEVNSCHITKVNKELFSVNSACKKNELEKDTEDKMLAIACENGNLECYGLHNRQLCLVLKHHEALNTCCFINATTLIAGSHDGTLLVVDIRWPHNFLVCFKPCGSPVHSVYASRALSHPCFWASCGNGRSSLYQVIITPKKGKITSSECPFEGRLHLVCELTGPDCDPVYQIIESSDGFVYTACRDVFIRKYKLAHIV